MAKIYGTAPNRYIRHPVTGQKLTVGNTNAGADLSYQEALAMADYQEGGQDVESASDQDEEKS